MRNEQLSAELERVNSEHTAVIAAMEQVCNKRAISVLRLQLLVY